MKFAKQLQHDRVPEWIDHYLNYKLGKKKIKQYEAAKRRGASYPSRDVDEFFQSELLKVEQFYKQKEEGAIERMLELKSQFNIYQEQLFLRGSIVQNHDALQDYTRPKVHRRQARKQLKQALIEFYRGLELLQSYAAMNITAFRKLNKKFDKAYQRDNRPLLRYYSDNVQHAYFYQSRALETIVVEVEELYAKHYEQGNQKAAVDELKAKSSPDWMALSWAMFANGMFAGFGTALGIIGLVDAGVELQEEPALNPHNSFLLQIYGGYFLMVLLMIFFCLSCVVFDKARINYQFIFNLNPYQSLDWREMLVLPLLFYFFVGFCMWMSFSFETENFKFRIYWPVILIATTLAILILPAPTLYARSRKWFLKHVGRLVVSPLSPVTFPDFFVGDMFCSLSYSMSVYYLAMAWDVLVRFNWIAYVAINAYPQHSSLASFLVAFTEVTRRGVWSIFRVENEHWGNVRSKHAYRDPPLPYKIADTAARETAATSGVDLERTGSKPGVPMNGLRRRKSSSHGNTAGRLSRLDSNMSVLNDAHMQDYTRGPDGSGSDRSTDDEEEPDEEER
ncbi:MAG: hypothetical protein Q9162_000567 [Coniocarpon cinnabarinum]